VARAAAGLLMLTGSGVSPIAARNTVTTDRRYRFMITNFLFGSLRCDGSPSSGYALMRSQKKRGRGRAQGRPTTIGSLPSSRSNTPPLHAPASRARKRRASVWRPAAMPRALRVRRSTTPSGTLEPQTRMPACDQPASIRAGFDGWRPPGLAARIGSGGAPVAHSCAIRSLSHLRRWSAAVRWSLAPDKCPPRSSR